MKKINRLTETKYNIEAATWGRFYESRALAAVRWFQINRHPKCRELCGEQAARLDGLKELEQAMEKNDAAFFHQLAEVLDFMNARTADKPEWRAFGVYIRRQQRAIEDGKRTAPITRREVEVYLASKFPGAVSERTLARMVKAFGMPLKRGKPGPRSK